MIDTLTKRCAYPDCKIFPKYGKPGTKELYCVSHKLDGMENVKSKKCLDKKCSTTAKFGFPGKKLEYCSSHKLDGMENLTNRRCLHEECTKHPSYGVAGELPEYCKLHKKIGMFYTAHKSCLNSSCSTRPIYGYPGKSPKYCINHKLDKMVDVNSTKCIICGLFCVSNKTNYLCSSCNPSSYQKTKEGIVKELLEEYLPDFKFIHNKQFSNNLCLKERPDFLFDCGNYNLILECDENGHLGYDKECEINRMSNISFGIDKPTKFIRYNPDLKDVSASQKHFALIEILTKWLNMKILEDPSPIYLFYPQA
jgi:hypothetical protein